MGGREGERNICTVHTSVLKQRMALKTRKKKRSEEIIRQKRIEKNIIVDGPMKREIYEPATERHGFPATPLSATSI